MKTALARWPLVGIVLGLVSLLLGFVSISCVFDSSGLAPDPSISGNPPDVCKGQYYEYTFEADGGTPPYKWSIRDSDGNDDPTKLPPGLKLTPGKDSKYAKLSGIATQEGKYPFQVTVVDAQNRSYSEDVTLRVSEFLITTAALPNFCQGAKYDVELKTCGGVGKLTWSTSGTLPSGLAITPQGHLAGTSTQAGQFKFKVHVTDSSSPPKKDEKEYELESDSDLKLLSAQALPAGATGKPYGPFQFQACGGQPPFTWSEPDKKLAPWGLSLSSAGKLTGTPKVAGTHQFRVRVSDSATPKKQSKEGYFLLAIAAGPLALTSTSPLPDATECKGYTYAFGASGGSGSYQWSAGVLPKGLSLDKGGTLFGTPPLPTPNPASLQVTVTDAKDASKTASKTFSLKVAENPVATPELQINELRHATGESSFYNMFNLAQPSVNVKLDFRFATLPYLSQPMPKASLQLVGGPCTPPLPALNVSAGPQIIAGKKVRVAEFSGPAVHGLLKGKKAGDTVRLRFSVDVTVDGQTKTFVNLLNVTLYYDED